MPAKPRPSTRSSNPRTADKLPKEPRFDRDNKPARAHRDDTPEAKEQRARLPKTHPNSAGRQAAARKPRKGEKE
jgi:hypothetical protein